MVHKIGMVLLERTAYQSRPPDTTVNQAFLLDEVPINMSIPINTRRTILLYDFFGLFAIMGFLFQYEGVKHRGKPGPHAQKRVMNSFTYVLLVRFLSFIDDKTCLPIDSRHPAFASNRKGELGSCVTKIGVCYYGNTHKFLFAPNDFQQLFLIHL